MCQFSNVPVSMWLQLFDLKIVPILQYGSEIWGFHQGDDIEIVHNKFCKFVLCLGGSAPNIAARGELGRQKMATFRYIKIIKYWLKLLNADQNRYIRVCYQYQYEKAERNGDCWGLNVKNLLYSLGFGIVWENQGVGNELVFISEFKQRCFDVGGQQWHETLAETSKLDTYRLYKNNLNTEDYTLIIKNRKYLSALSRFRCSNHKLQIEAGRHVGLTRDDRICMLCNLNEIENEIHFLLKCPLYDDLRSKYNLVPVSHCDRLEDVFVRVMLTSDKWKLASYLYHAESRRDSVLSL